MITQTRIWQLLGVLVCLLVALPAMADTRFRARQMTRNDVPFGKGQCDIRLQVDGEAEVSVRGDMVYVRTISGRDARDDGSECNEPLPARNLRDFQYEVKDRRGDIRLLDQPSPRNGFSAIVRIRDSSGGEGRYHFRLSWLISGGGIGPGGGGGDWRPDRGPGGRRDIIHFRSRGSGALDRRGEPPRRIREVNVDVDRDGSVTAVFDPDGRMPLAFAGRVTSSQGDTVRAAVSAGDRFGMRGEMVISLDRRGEVLRINVEGMAGRDRFRLDWTRD